MKKSLLVTLFVLALALCQPHMGKALSKLRRKKAMNDTISIVSYNIWFDPLDRVPRLEALFALIADINPNIVGLNECTPETMPAIRRAMEAMGYKHYEALEGRRRPPWLMQRYFSTLWGKGEWTTNETIAFPKTTMARKLGVGTIDSLPGITFAVSHLESLTFRDVRYEQLMFSLNHLQSDDNVVLMGDTNWRPWDKLVLPKPWRDAWLALGYTEEEGLTKDGDINPYLVPMFPNDPAKTRPRKERLDRFFVKLKDYELSSMRVLGKEPFAEGMWISDHFGVHLTLKRTAGSATPIDASSASPAASPANSPTPEAAPGSPPESDEESTPMDD